MLPAAWSAYDPPPTATAREYDGGSSPTAATKGDLTKVTDESGVMTYACDSLGHMTAKTVITNGKTYTVTCTWGNTGSAMDKVTAITWNADNNLKGWTWSDGSALAYRYGASTSPTQPA